MILKLLSIRFGGWPIFGIYNIFCMVLGFSGDTVVKNLPVSVGDVRDVSLIFVLGS